MKKDLHEALPIAVPNQEQIQNLRDFLKNYIAEELLASGTFHESVVEKKIIQAMPSIDEVMLSVRLPIFKEEIEHYVAGLKSARNKAELSTAITQKIDSSLNFLLS